MASGSSTYRALTSGPVFWVLVALAVVAAPLIDFVSFHGDPVAASLYAIPVLLAAPVWSPHRVAVVGVIVILLHLISTSLQGGAVAVWPVQVLSLALVVVLAVVLAVQRQETIRRAHEAEVAREQLQTFMGMVVHELATPLTSILGSTQVLLRRSEPGQDQQLIAMAEREARTMSRLIEDLRDAARIGAGHFEIHPQPVDVMVVVREAEERLQALAGERALELHGPDTLSATADRQRLGQAIGNLLSNALKYSPIGSPVEITVDKRGGSAIVRIADQGPGIPPESQKELFQPFARLDRTAAVAGTGLGLYISRGIVEAHGGRILLESAPGKGSAFSIVLPLANGITVAAATPAHFQG
ncbi:MAG: HAMP domain-containing histidine kinase [Chloroflexi bacterium]|nr:HAMP domain-containing histidine kinase [Chloroflexota bacterium]